MLQAQLQLMADGVCGHGQKTKQRSNLMADYNEEMCREPRSWLLMRPPEVTNSLPWEYRWEFTRRHPYYQQFWGAAQRYHREPNSDSVQRTVDQAAILILGAIGVASSQVPQDPGLSAKELGSRDLGGAWLGGAVAPATLRTLAHMLLLALPKEERGLLSQLLSESAAFDCQDRDHMHQIHQRLAEFKATAWDSFPKAPVYSINLQMPQRAIKEAIESLVRQGKKNTGMRENRRRDDKFKKYLEVWDLREGWQDGTYVGFAENKFREIAKKTHRPFTTLISQYRTAFRLLSGHDYTRELWIRLLGPLKLSRFYAGGLARHRPWKSPSPRPVSKSVLLPGRKEFESSEFLKAAGVTSSQFLLADLAMDIENLLTRGLSDDAIYKQLELSDPGDRDLIAELRSRYEEE